MGPRLLSRGEEALVTIESVILAFQWGRGFSAAERKELAVE